MQGNFETLYQLAFVSAALAIAILERLRVLQRETPHTARRWTTNIGLFLIGSMAAGLALPVGVYAFAKAQPPGLMSELELPLASQFVLTFLVLDAWKYWEHRMYHRFRPLWRIHLVHHSDTYVDVTTSERHHPFEVLLATAVLVALIVALGLPATALGAYLLTATIIALLSHGNLRLPAALDRALRHVIVTPGFHAIHHSDRPSQTDSNYSAVLTVWDRLFATYVDPGDARIRHFGLEYFHQPKDTSLSRVLLQPLLFRRDLDYPARSTEQPGESASSPIHRLSRRERTILLGGALGCALVLTVMWPAILQLTNLWGNTESYQFAWLVIPMFFYVLWATFQRAEPMRLEPDFSGLPVVMVAAGLWGAASLTNLNFGQQIALVLALQGVAASTFGWRRYLRLFPIFALLFLMIPISDLLIPGLRMLTLKSIEGFATWANIPYRVDDFVIYIGTQRYVVVDDCSGVAYVTLGGFLAYACGLLLYRSLAKLAALFLLGAAIGIVSNVLRVNAIVVVDWLRNSQMDLAAHGSMQWLALFVGLGVLFYMLNRLGAESLSPSSANTTTTARVTRMRMVAPVLVGASALVMTGAASSLDRSSPTVQHVAAAPFPERIREWVLVQLPGRWLPDGTGSNASIEAIYREQNREMRVVVLQTLSPTAKLQEAMLVSKYKGTWREKNLERVRACHEGHCSSVIHVIWQRSKSDHVRHVYFAYAIGHVVTSSKLELRLAHGWQRFRGMGEMPYLIALVADGTSLDEADIVAAFNAIQRTVSQRSKLEAKPGPPA